MTPPTPAPSPEHCTLTVLYVEDDAVNVALMRYVMELRPQVQLEVATDGLAGVEAATRLLPDLILLDMDLPLLSGMGVLGRLKADPRTAHIPCVAVSANSQATDIQAAMDGGVRAYMVKPFPLANMLALVDSLLPLGAA